MGTAKPNAMATPARQLKVDHGTACRRSDEKTRECPLRVIFVVSAALADVRSSAVSDRESDPPVCANSTVLADFSSEKLSFRQANASCQMQFLVLTVTSIASTA